MKKTLAALAVLGAFAAGSAYAADVTLYGIVDVGLKYTYQDSDIKGQDDTNTLEMAAGNQSGSRFGLKGTEDLGNGYSVGFVLENGFNSDDGTLGNNGRLFGREASLQLRTPFGEFGFGRMGQLTSGNGTYGIAGNLTPFGTSWGGYAVESSTYFVGYSRMDNTVTYKSPNFAGINVYAQYSFDGNTLDEWEFDDYDDTLTDNEGHSAANRYAALGVTYGNGPLNLVFTADWYDWSKNFLYNSPTTKPAGADQDDGYAFTLGGSYDFDVVKVYLAGQYFDNMYKQSSNVSGQTDSYFKIGTGITGQMKGYAVTAGVGVPLWGGTGMFAVGYADVEACDNDKTGFDKAESTRLGASIGYDYPFSKRTNMYVVGGYYQDSIDNERYTSGGETYKRDRDPTTGVIVIGMRHKF